MTTESLNLLRDAYVRMATIRQFEATATELTKGAEPAIAGSIHPCAGQEAIPVGALNALEPGDRVVATYRGHGWALECGIRPDEAMAEMCQRQTGINGGRAGSLMMSAPKRGFIGENSVVGAGGPIACGVALAAKVRGERKVVAVSFGDGATSQGGLHEAFVTAATLKLPVIFVCENNEWAEMTPTSHVILGGIASRAASYGMFSEEVDGGDVEAVRAAVARAARRARDGEGPTLLECHTVRLWGHYNKDIEHYRPKANRLSALARDPIARLKAGLIERGLTQSDIDGMDEAAAAVIADAAARAIAAPAPAIASVGDNLFATAAEGARATAAPETTNLTYAQAINRALHDAMAADDRVVLFGEDVALPGGVFGLSRGLLKAFGDRRVFDTPIAETAILGTAVGAAIEGLRPVAEIMFGDFMFVALDQIVNQAANVRYVSNGLASAPLVVRTQQGVTPGSCAQHAQCIEAHLANVPGIKVGLPITPNDAYAMLRAAIADPDPCIIIEARSAFGLKGDVTTGGDLETAEGARLVRDGSDVGIITWGTSLIEAEIAAGRLAARGISAALLDLRWLSPIDDAAIGNLVRRTGRIIVVHEASQTGGFGAEIAARIHERHHDLLDGPVIRLGGRDVRMPAAPVLQREVIPTAERIYDKVLGMLATRIQPDRADALA